jgi:hypothetical protein
MLINSKKFNFNFFLSDRKKVKSLHDGALQHGGATKYNTGIYSNVSGNEYIRINKSNNTISVFIPSTTDCNIKTDNSDIIQYSINYLKAYYSRHNTVYYNTKGSWYSSDKNDVVEEDITIMSIRLQTVTDTDIKVFITLAEYIKKAMKQEGVSIAVNKALCII